MIFEDKLKGLYGSIAKIRELLEETPATAFIESTDGSVDIKQVGAIFDLSVKNLNSILTTVTALTKEIGNAPLTTKAQDLTSAINELKTVIDAGSGSGSGSKTLYNHSLDIRYSTMSCFLLANIINSSPIAIKNSDLITYFKDANSVYRYGITGKWTQKVDNVNNLFVVWAGYINGNSISLYCYNIATGVEGSYNFPVADLIIYDNVRSI